MPGKIAYRIIPRFLQVGKTLHIFKMPAALCQFYAAFRFNSVVHCNKQRFGEIQKTHTRAAVSPFARNGNFYTAYSAVIVSVFFFYAAFNKRRYDNFVVVKCGHTEAQFYHFYTFFHKSVVQPRMIAHS